MRSISSAEVFCAGLLGSAALHLAVLVGLTGAGYVDRTVAGSGPGETPRPVSVTSVAAAPAVTESPTSAVSKPAAAESPGSDAAPVAAAEPAASAGAASSPETASRASDDFVPRRYLTVVPKAVTDVTVFYPETDDAVGRRKAILALFIDETGVVQRVRIDGEPLPRDMEEAARNAFLAARFTPGELEGRIVKSLIRVEVTFESTPLPGAAEAVALPEAR